MALLSVNSYWLYSTSDPTSEIKLIEHIYKHVNAWLTAALTIYDMCKAVDRVMEIGAIRLTHKSGGKSGVFDAE